jgi:hypothetical protein
MKCIVEQTEIIYPEVMKNAKGGRLFFAFFFATETGSFRFRPERRFPGSCRSGARYFVFGRTILTLFRFDGAIKLSIAAMLVYITGGAAACAADECLYIAYVTLPIRIWTKVKRPDATAI